MVDFDEGPTVRLVAHCRRCHGWLLSAGSVAAGIGPTCAIRERAERRAAAAESAAPTLFDLPDGGDVASRGPLTLFDLAG